MALFSLLDNSVNFSQQLYFINSPVNFFSLGGYGGVGLDLYWFEVTSNACDLVYVASPTTPTEHFMTGITEILI